MPRYYFDLLDDDGQCIDEEGLELPSLRAVQAEAAKALADMARDALHSFEGTSKRFMAIEVRDNSGPVMQVRCNFEVMRLKQ